MAHYIPPNVGSGSLCEHYGHNWRTTKKKGQYQCSNCKKLGYCKACCLAVPMRAFLMRCNAHKEVH